MVWDAWIVTLQGASRKLVSWVTDQPPYLLRQPKGVEEGDPQPVVELQRLRR
jgi:hypothetical protein